jgi:4'-phosphopantetheinyl transferase
VERVKGSDALVSVHARGSRDDDRAVLVARVASALGCSEDDVVITRSCASCGAVGHGEPVVTAPEPVFVSLSRAGSLVAIAVSRTARVGVDIESLEAVAAAGFDDVAFTPRERARVAASSDATALRASLWTRKEALLKFTGVGLRVDPADVELGDDGQLEHWSAAGERPLAVLRAFDPGAGYVGTLAYSSRGTDAE